MRAGNMVYGQRTIKRMFVSIAEAGLLACLLPVHSGMNEYYVQ